jgi:hypothetical protein
MRFVSSEGFVIDDVYITALALLPTRSDIVHWEIWVKPLALDEVLWAAFMPDEVMGHTMRINRRVNGAFQIRPLSLESETQSISNLDNPDAFWDDVVEHFFAVRNDFIARHPTVLHFLALVSAPDGEAGRRHDLEREITTLIAAGHGERAARLADAAVARGEHGTMWSAADTGVGVLELLSAYARGPESYAAFKASLTPTHTLERLREVRPSTKIGLVRGRHQGRFRDDLNEFDGHDTWAMILGTRPSPGSEQDEAGVRFLQAAGTADAMTVEIREPGGRRWGAVSVRSKVGLPGGVRAGQDAAIELPHGTEIVGAAEVFTAEQAADLFEAYYETGTIPAGYPRRPVEGFAADGGFVSPP